MIHDSDVDEYIAIIFNSGHLILNKEDGTFYTRLGNGIGTIIDQVITDKINY